MTPSMKETSIRIISGIVIILSSIFIVFFGLEYLNIYEVINLKWFPILSAFIGFYFAGLVTKKVRLKFIGVLFLALLIFIPFRYFYFPMIIILLFFAFWALAISRNEIKRKIKLSLSILGVLIFAYFLLNQPLILKQEGFGTDTSGNLINAKELWNFKKYSPKEVKNESFINLDGEKIKLTEIEGKVFYISFWATWCGPCIANKPILDKLKEEFKDQKKIVFVDISIDQNKEQWKKYLKKNNVKGLQLISINENLTRRNFDINGIPKHIIMNSEYLYKELDYINGARKYLESQELMNKWIKSDRLVIERSQ